MKARYQSSKLKKKKEKEEKNIALESGNIL